MKKTKIIATYGPAVAGKEAVGNLIEAGVNLFRVNCSHGKKDDFLRAARQIRLAQAKSPFPVGILFDLCGPKIRLAPFQGELAVRKGDRISLSRDRTDLSEGVVAVNQPGLVDWIKKGERLFIDDGNVIFEIVKKGKDRIDIKAVNDGLLLPGKGINLPDTVIPIPTITAKDRRDLKTAVEAGADYIALSFVRSEEDLVQARRLIRRHKGHQRVIAKLEKREAILALEGIIEKSDGVMIARGDLGVELAPEELPKLQKRIIELANRHLKPVIVATQMLESMRFSPRATRAEVNDVASAVFDYADAVMLSAETATGKYPEKAVRTMDSILRATEPAAPPPAVRIRKEGITSRIPMAVADAVSRVNDWCDIEIIFAFSSSGFTAEMISNLFPPKPIVALTPDGTVWRQLGLTRSVYPLRVKRPRSFDELLKVVQETCRRLALAKPGDKVIVTCGVPFGASKLTNLMMIHEL